MKTTRIVSYTHLGAGTNTNTVYTCGEGEIVILEYAQVRLTKNAANPVDTDAAYITINDSQSFHNVLGVVGRNQVSEVEHERLKIVLIPGQTIKASSVRASDCNGYMTVVYSVEQTDSTGMNPAGEQYCMLIDRLLGRC